MGIEDRDYMRGKHPPTCACVNCTGTRPDYKSSHAKFCTCVECEPKNVAYEHSMHCECDHCYKVGGRSQRYDKPQGVSGFTKFILSVIALAIIGGGIGFGFWYFREDGEIVAPPPPPAPPPMPMLMTAPVVEPPENIVLTLLPIEPPRWGRVSVSNVGECINSGECLVSNGTYVELNATPSNLREFWRWECTGSCPQVLDNPSISLILTQDTRIGAVFTEPVTLTINQSEFGRVSSIVPSSCIEKCIVKRGSTITVSAEVTTPRYRFSHWSCSPECPGANQQTMQLAIRSRTEITPHFEPVIDTYRYLIDLYPESDDANTQIQSVNRAIGVWEFRNSFLEFERVSRNEPYDFTINFIDLPESANYVGLYCPGGCSASNRAGILTNSFRFGSSNEIDEILIDTGSESCDNEWYIYSERSLADTVAHEIGHYLGLDHHPDENHLLYGDDASGTFDDLGYDIPNQIWRFVETARAVELDMQLNDNLPYVEYNRIVDEINCINGFG